MFEKTRLRFAPSPTGPLHLGGVRTALFSYLYAKKHHGDFILRIEDTDRNRMVEGAEEYIQNALEWCDLIPDESPSSGGGYGPYRQSERLELYQKYAQELIDKGLAYYAFDTKEEIEAMREREQEKGNHSAMYGHKTRMQMRNSISMDEAEVNQLLDLGVPYVIRFLVPENKSVVVADMIRGEIETSTNELDDKVLLKQDGFPTYHLAVVVDDYLMKISHVFRGEEWLPSAPFHVLLWSALGWQNHIPKWAHLPLILKPSGKGKLGKRDAEQLGFSVFPLDWKSPETGTVSLGYDSLGFIPEGFVNMLLMLGWHGEGDKEVYTRDEMIQNFDTSGISHAGAKFDYEKAVWYNQQQVHRLDPPKFKLMCQEVYDKKGWLDESLRDKVPGLIQERIALMADVVSESQYFFRTPEQIDTSSFIKNWNDDIRSYFDLLLSKYEEMEGYEEQEIESVFKTLMSDKGYKPGQVMMPYRVMLVGEKRGVGVFAISAAIGKEETIKRIKNAITQIENELK